METLGELALWIAFPGALWAGAVSLLGARDGRAGLVDAGRWAARGVCALVAAATLILAWAFLVNDTGFNYVYDHSSARLGPLQRVTALWAGHEGAQLLWALAVAGVAVAWAGRPSRDTRGKMDELPASSVRRDDGAKEGAAEAGEGVDAESEAARALGALTILLAALIGLVLFPDSPFAPLGFAAADGRGLRPELLNPWMAIHPPLMVAGLAALGAGFAIAMSSGSGALQERSVVRMTDWNRVAWTTLSLGLLAGMRWAYGEVGWGGAWSWDPAQSAALLPWLVSTALLHSLPVQRRTGGFALWNRALATGAVVCAIVAAAVARSGRFGSIHAFAVESASGFALLVLAAGIAVAGLTVLWRASRRHGPASVDGARRHGFRGHGGAGDLEDSRIARDVRIDRDTPPSREPRMSAASGGAAAARVMTVHAVLLVVAGIVGWGLIFPALADGFTSRTVWVGAPWFDGFVAPAGLVLLLLVMLAPFGRRGLPFWWLAWPASAAGAAGVGLVLLGIREPLAVVAIALAVAALTSTGLEGAVRRDRAWRHARLGRACGHAGIALLAIGMAGGALETVERQSVEPGDELVVRSVFGEERTLRYVGLSSQAGPATWEIIASFRIVEESGAGPFVDSRQQVHELGQGRGTRAGIRPGLFEDLRLSLFALDENVGLGNDPDHQGASVEVSIRPFGSWTWIGGLLAVFGVIVAGGRGSRVEGMGRRHP